MLCLKIAGWVVNSTDPDEMLFAQANLTKYLQQSITLRVMLNQTGKIMTKSSLISNRLSITMVIFSALISQPETLSIRLKRVLIVMQYALTSQRYLTSLLNTAKVHDSHYLKRALQAGQYTSVLGQIDPDISSNVVLKCKCKNSLSENYRRQT